VLESTSLHDSASHAQIKVLCRQRRSLVTLELVEKMSRKYNIDTLAIALVGLLHTIPVMPQEA